VWALVSLYLLYHLVISLTFKGLFRNEASNPEWSRLKWYTTYSGTRTTRFRMRQKCSGTSYIPISVGTAPAVSYIITNKPPSPVWTLALMNVSCSLPSGPIRLIEELQLKTLLEILWQALTSMEHLKGRFRTSWQLEYGVSTVGPNYCLLVSIVFWSDQGHEWEERVWSGRFWWPVDYPRIGLYHALLPPTLSNLSIPHHMPRFQIFIP